VNPPDHFVVPFFDAPVQMLPPLPSKEVLERLQLERFRIDYLARRGSVPFEDVRRGGDPPDFLVRAGDSWLGLDCAALAWQEKRHAEALFLRLKRRLLDQPTKSLAHLADTQITVWFEAGTELPPRSTDEEFARAVYDALQDARIDRARIAEISSRIQREGFPERLPDGLGLFDFGTFGFEIAPVEGWRPFDEASSRLGFSLTLSFTTPMRPAAEELRRIVREHDREGVHQLLAVVGGPDRAGIAYPSEEIYLPTLTEQPPTDLVARNILLVTIHSWQTGNMLEFRLDRSGHAA
jgi:hypothetical protein